MTGLLGLIIMYIYAMIAFYDPIVHSTINNNQMGIPLCIDAFNCFLFAVNMGLRAGGGVGDVADQPSPFHLDTFTARFFYDLTFFILIIIIWLNIIFGIIIDTFAELRDEKTRKGNIFFFFLKCLFLNIFLIFEV